jgi:hypothetical protein
MMRVKTVTETYATCSTCKAEVRIVPFKGGKRRMSRHNDNRGLSRRNFHMADVCDGTEWHSEKQRQESVGYISF